MTRRPNHVGHSRHLVLIFALVALVASLASPVAAAEPKVRAGGTPLPYLGSDRVPALNVPNGTLGFKSHLAWLYNDGSIAVVGEVLNNTTKRVTSIDLRVTWFDSSDPGANILGTKSDAVIIDRVARGAVAPFVVYDDAAPDGTAAYTIEFVDNPATTTTAVAGGGLNIVMGTSYVNGDTRYYPGTIKNPNAFAVSSLRIGLTAYAGASSQSTAGDVLEVMEPNPLVTSVAANGQASFLIGIAKEFSIQVDPDPAPPVVIPLQGVRILADGYRADQTSVYITSWANYFDDLAGISFKDDIVWMAENAITKGCASGKYCPNANVRRDEMASFLARALGLSGAAPNAFTDDNGNTHEVDINRIAAAGHHQRLCAAEVLPRRQRPTRRDGLVPGALAGSDRERPRRLHRRQRQHPREQHQPRGPGRSHERMQRRRSTARRRS